MTEPNAAATEDVLRVLYQAGVGVSPGVVVANLAEVRGDPPDEAAVRSAIDDLEAEGVVRELDAGERSSPSPPSPSAREDAGDVYELTDAGRDRVEAEVDAEAPGYVD